MNIKMLVCNLTNCALPGLGTILAGGFFIGIVQFVIELIVIALTVISGGLLLPITLPVFVINVIWSCVSVCKLTGRKRRYPPTHR